MLELLLKIKKGQKISYTNIIKVFKIGSIFLSLSLILMIFFISTKNDFEKTSLVETKDLNIGSEGNSFQVDNAQLSGLNKLGNSFNIKAKKINPIDNKLPIISGDEITGRIYLSSEILIQIKAKTAELNTKNNILRLHGDFKIENEKYQINGKEIFFNFEKGTILSNHKVTVLFPNWQIYGGKIEIYNSENSEKNLLFFIDNGVKIKYLL